MMERKKWKVVACLMIATFAIACSSSTAQPDDEPDNEAGDEGVEAPVEEQAPGVFDIDQSEWTQKRRALDGEVKAFLSNSTMLSNGFREGPEPLAAAATEKADIQQELERKLDAKIQGSDQEPELVAWSIFRTGQLYLNFGCELEAMAIPEGISPAQEEEYRQMITGLVAPWLVYAHGWFLQGQEPGAAPWSDYAADAIAALGDVSGGELDPTAQASVCGATADLWRIDGSETVEDAED